MGSSMSTLMSTFSIKEKLDDLSKEVADVFGATAFLLRGTDGMVVPLWEGVATWSRVCRVAVGLSATVVAGAVMRSTEAFMKEQVETWEDACAATFLPLPLPFNCATSFTLDGGAWLSYSGSSFNSITSGQSLQGCCKGFLLHRARIHENNPSTNH